MWFLCLLGLLLKRVEYQYMVGEKKKEKKETTKTTGNHWEQCRYGESSPVGKKIREEGLSSPSWSGEVAFF